MTPESTTTSWRLGVSFMLLFGALGAGVAWYGVQDGVGENPAPPPIKATPLAPQLAAIVLPHDEPALPPGPHREAFRVACTTCHSPRLVFTQPTLTPKQWQGVVHKMVAAYGAPLTKDEEKRIVEYVVAVKGK